MIAFLFKGLIRDRSRSLFPFLTVVAGVVLTVVLQAMMNGIISSMIQSTAHYSTGHVCVLTRAYAKEVDQVPNDLALLGIDTLLTGLRRDFPTLLWTPRTKFGGILDVPDSLRETKAQAPVAGMAVDLFSTGSPEEGILNIRQALIRGRVPRRHHEIIVGDELATTLKLEPGDTATLMSSTMFGSMSLTNVVIAGTVRFGIVAMDKGMVIADISDMQQALDMPSGAGEILGFFPDDLYHEEQAEAVSASFNTRFAPPAVPLARDSLFAPLMGSLRSQSGLADYLDLVNFFSRVIVGVFILAMSLVLWNAGLTGSLRRYGEIGVRLALGEDKTHVYRSLLAESVIIGLLGSCAGTVLGVAIAHVMQVKGLDIGAIMKESSMMLPTVIRTRITPAVAVIGFVPGMMATLLGTAISGIGIYKRQTSALFKELEA